MSLLQFQTALAKLIRLPEKNRGEYLERFLEGFEFTENERVRIRHLAENPLVAKYGRSMAGVRWETPELQLRLTQRLVPKSALECLYYEIFEPQAVDVYLPNITDRFLSCLIDDSAAHKILREAAPPSVFDAMKFERIQLAFFRGDIMMEKEPAPAHSSLRHHAFRCLALDYDIPAFLSAAPEQNPLPLERKLMVLFIPDETAPGARYFEIDSPLAQFLETLKENPQTNIELPSSFGDLVELGLCRPLA